MVTLALALLGFQLPVASAQTFDALGPVLPPVGPGVRAPVAGLGGAETGAPIVGLTVETGTDLLVYRIAQGPDSTELPIIDDIAGLTLSARTGIYGPLGVGLSVPTWVVFDGEAAGGPAMGDMTLWVPVEVLGLDGLTAGLAPVLRLPTGASARYLGSGGVTGGLTASVGGDLGRFFAHLDAGFDVAPQTDVPEWPGGAHYLYAIDAGAAPVDAVGLHLEVRSRAPFSSVAPTLPTELMGTVKVQPQERIWLTGTLGRAITRGVGTGAYRMVLGVAVAPGTQPVEAEIVATPEPKEIHVIDSRRFPITGATVTAGALEGETDIEGHATLPPRALRDGVLLVEHPHYEPMQISVHADDPFFEVQMDRRPVPVAVSVVGPEGALMLVEIEVDGPYDPGPALIDEAGVHNWDLRQGTWQVRMTSPGLGSQERTIVIENSRVDPIRVDAVLASSVAAASKVRVEVVDRLGRPVEDAVVALESRDLGTTGTGGDVVVEGISTGDHALTIRSERFGQGAEVQLVVDEDGEQTVQAVVDWRPGSVQVTAVDPKGRPLDATVNFVGPANLPPRGTGTDGDEIFVLRPGSWDVEISAPGMGTQTRTIEVTEEEGELVAVAVGMQADEGGASEVRLRVKDAEGNAVEGVDVLLDGERVGTTSPNGDLALQGLQDGSRTFTLSGPMIEEGEKRVTVVAGKQVTDAVVAWTPGATELTAVDAGGRPVNALIQFDGPERVADLSLGLDGSEQLVLRPGRWTVTAGAPGFANQQRVLAIEEGKSRRNELTFKLAPDGEVGRVAVNVVGPDGRVVAQADVLIDGQAVGITDDGVLVADGIAVGPTLIDVQVEGMRSRPVPAAVMQDEERVVDVPLEWAPGALEVTVTGPDSQPLEARITLRAPDGSSPVSPRVAEDGNALIGAVPGDWKMVVEAEGMQTQVLDVQLSDEAELTSVPVAMAPRPDDSGAAVLVKAETRHGDALANAEVKVDGVVVGRTSSAGTFELTEVPDSNFSVEIVPEDPSLHDAVVVPIDVSRRAERRDEEVQTTVVAENATQDVAVEVTDPFGNKVGAKVVAIQGANEADAVDLGGMESGKLALRPGVYTVTAMTEEGELAVADLVVPDRDPRAGGSKDAVATLAGADESGTSADGTATMKTGSDGMPMLSLRVEQVSAAMSDGLVVPVNPILFDTGMHYLRDDAAPLVRDLARWLSTHREAALIEVGGHTDDVGGVVVNQQLSERRAATVRQALIDAGVAPERLQARGYGLSRPVTANQDTTERQRNRRVELVVLDWSE